MAKETYLILAVRKQLEHSFPISFISYRSLIGLICDKDLILVVRKQLEHSFPISALSGDMRQMCGRRCRIFSLCGVRKRVNLGALRRQAAKVRPPL